MDLAGRESGGDFGGNVGEAILEYVVRKNNLFSVEEE